MTALRRFAATSLSLAMLVAASSATATAQPSGGGAPGQTPPRPAAQYNTPYTQRYALLTPEERELIAHGEIDPGQVVAGGLVGTFFGFGLGHAVQGRFSDRGWIFLLGEGASVASVMTFALTCVDGLESRTCDNNAGFLVAGLVGIVVFRVWEIVDVWGGPSGYNLRVRQARAKLYGAPVYQPPRYGLFVAPTFKGGSARGGGGITGGVAGVSLQF